MKKLFCLLIPIFLVCCNMSPGRIVTVWDSEYGIISNGVVIGPNTLITLGHCVGGGFRHKDIFVKSGRTWLKANIVDVISGVRDQLVILRVDTWIDWKPWVYFKPKIGTAYKTYLRHTGKTEELYKDCRPEPGDSGSPVVDVHGNLVGLIYGVKLTNGMTVTERVNKDLLDALKEE